MKPEAREPDVPPAKDASLDPADRGLPSVNRVASVQSRVSRVLAFALMGALGTGLLLWYYSGAAARGARLEAAAQHAARDKAAGDSTLPPLGRVQGPVVPRAAPLLPESVAGAEPPQTGTLAVDPATPAAAAPYGYAPTPAGMPPPPTPAEAALARRLSGAVFASSSSSTGPAMPTDPGRENAAEPSASLATAREGAASRGAQGELLKSSVLPVAQARVLPTRTLLLPKGAFLDCTLETAVDSTLPGLVTCLTATDTFSADGRVVLMERGTKLIGETRAEVARGAARLYVLWSEARTPTGVVVELASPATDALGRAGLPGEVERHFWARFGSAILLSVIDGAIQAGVERSRASGSSSVIVSPNGAREVMTESLKESASLSSSIRIPQGTPVQVLVARDLDFRSVYVLERVTPAAP